MKARGLMLLEVIISAGILFVVMLLLLNLATTSLWGTKEGGERLAAESHALSLLEEYRSRPFPSYPVDQPLRLEPYGEDGTEFHSIMRASALPGSSVNTLRQLSVTVSWSSTRGPREVTLSLYVTPLLR